MSNIVNLISVEIDADIRDRFLDTLLAKAASLKQKRPREALQEYADKARLSRDLVTIKLDVPVDIALEDLAVQEPDVPALTSLLSQFEFYTLAETMDLPGSDQEGSADSEDLEVAVEVVDHAGRRAPREQLAAGGEGYIDRRVGAVEARAAEREQSGRSSALREVLGRVR